jgi:uncharacterized protein (TIGR04255 family)
MARNPKPKLRNPPIVEAVFDVDCDLPPALDLAALEQPSRALFADAYPKHQKQHIHEVNIEAAESKPPSATTRRMGIQALQFRSDDEKQLVQVRAQGFSFNRLAPYTSLDDYLPEIERTWRLYADLVSPIRIRALKLRYINRILLPMTKSAVDLDKFLKIGPRLPDEEAFTLNGFLSQQSAVEKDTGLQMSLVLTAQDPEGDKLPVILDITVASAASTEPTDWSKMKTAIDALRRLKNRLFENSLTPKCIKLFQ